MQLAALFFVVLLALSGLAAASEGCCETDTIIFSTSTLTIFKPTATVYGLGYTSPVDNGSLANSLKSYPNMNVTANMLSTVAADFSQTSHNNFDALVASMTTYPSSNNITITRGSQSFTTTTDHITITAPTKVTCTISHACPNNGLPGTVDSGTQSQSEDSSSVFILTSSTVTRTITVLSGFSFSQYSPSIAPATPRPIGTGFVQSTNATKVMAPSTSVNGVNGGLKNSTSVVNTPAKSTGYNSTLSYTSPTLTSAGFSSSASSQSAPATTPAVTTAVTAAAEGPLTSTELVSISTVPVTSIVTVGGPGSFNTPPSSNAGRKPQPPRIFNVLASYRGSI